MSPILVAGVQCLLDQQSAKARAIDEQIRVQLLAARELDRIDEAVLRSKDDLDHLAFGAAHAARLGVAAQESCVQPCVEMVGVADCRER
jgi:hypothetical protein